MKAIRTIAFMGFVAVRFLTAQDVVIGSPQWVDPVDAPDQFPVENHPLKIEFPADLRNAPDLGYVCVSMFIDEKGNRLSFEPHGTLPAYELAVLKADRHWTHKPARRNGKPVNSRVEFLVVFNPASADSQKPDATARVLDAKIVRDPARKTAKGEPGLPPALVWATVSIDKQGRATAVRDVLPEMATLLESAAQRMKFSPARQGGEAVASELRVPFIVLAPDSEERRKQVVPRAISQVRPNYPYELRASGLRGDVLIDFVVDIEGRPTKAFVVRSLNPSFDEPALEALRKWKFAPGTVDGVPVNTHMRVPIFFELLDTPEGGDSGIEVRRPTNQSELPAEFRYDVAPKPLATVRAVYPYEQLLRKKEGKARVNFAVGKDGKVFYAKIISADSPEFGAALQAAVECHEFEPALKDGRPTQALMSIEQDFSVYGSESVVTNAERDLIEVERRHPERIVSTRGLDAKLNPISQRPPNFPILLDGVVDKGEATVEIVIDEDGHARLPRVISASNPAFGWSAVQAVSVWRFDPPTIGGKRTNVRIRIPFSFNGRHLPTK